MTVPANGAGIGAGAGLGVRRVTLEAARGRRSKGMRTEKTMARMHDSSWILLFRHAYAHQSQGWPAAPRSQPQQPKQRARQPQDGELENGTRQARCKYQGARCKDSRDGGYGGTASLSPAKSNRWQGGRHYMAVARTVTVTRAGDPLLEKPKRHFDVTGAS